MGGKCCKSQTGQPSSDILSAADQEMDDLLSEPSNGCPPFPPSIVGTFSNHGIQPGDKTNSPKQWFKGTPAKVKVNQDRGSVEYPFLDSFDSALFCVMDGHGRQGEKVSEFCVHNLHSYLGTNRAAMLADPSATFQKAFRCVHAKLKKATDINAWDSGTTAVVVYLKGHQLWIANAGDSRAVIASKGRTKGKLRAKDLSIDQNPDSAGEFERLCAAGGVVAAPEAKGLSARVWTPNRTIGLSMARSLGDFALSKHGVIATPEVTEHTLQPDDQVLILASDGVWEFITSQEAVDIISHYPDDATEACRQLLLVATQKWREEEGPYRDDITAIVVYLNELLPNFVDGTIDSRTRAASRECLPVSIDDVTNMDDETSPCCVVAMDLDTAATGVSSKPQSSFKQRRLSLGDKPPSMNQINNSSKLVRPRSRSTDNQSVIAAPLQPKPKLRVRRRPSLSPDMDPSLIRINPS